jgi:hypothetical protein
MRREAVDGCDLAAVCRLYEHHIGVRVGIEENRVGLVAK